MKKKLKVLLLNLPAPALHLSRFRERCQNIPLACGYMKAYAQASGPAGDMEIDIAPRLTMNLGGDAGLISCIMEKNYDIVGFSLYQWNALRSLHIMREVKRITPDIRFLVGGPEVSSSTEYLMEEKALDFMIEGEGEEPFRSLLISLLDKGRGIDNIPGLIFRDQDRMIINAPPEALTDISVIPSPYLLGFLELESQRILHIETMRGCVFNCKYCSWNRGGRKGVSFFALERIREEVRLARKKGIRILRLDDASVNVSKEWLKSICGVISSENRDRLMQVYSFIHPELIDEESASWLSEANFKGPNVGLQSTNPEALSAMGRAVNLDDYVRGTSLLKKYNIGYMANIILGLPGDTLEGFKRTIDFLLEHDQKTVICFPLSVAPNTFFRERSGSLGITFQKMPPNLVISTPMMDFDSMRTGIRLFREKFSRLPFEGFFEKDKHYLGRKSYPSPHFCNNEALPHLTTYIHGSYPWKGSAGSPQVPLVKALSSQSLYPLTRVILSKECRSVDSRSVEKIASLLSPRLCWNTLFWLESFGSEHEILFLETFLAAVSIKNPCHNWHVILEFEREMPMDFLSSISSSVRSEPTILEYESLYEQEGPAEEFVKISPLIYAVVPYNGPGFSREWIIELSRRVPLFFSLTLPGKIDEMPEMGTGFVIDFSPDIRPPLILYTLNMIWNSEDDRPFFFRNWVIQRLWSSFCHGEFRVRGADENVLEVEEWDRVRLTTFSDGMLKTQMSEWIRSRNESRRNLSQMPPQSQSQ